jgi:inner membrane protein
MLCTDIRSLKEPEMSRLPEIIWFVVGLVLILLEFAAPGVFLIFFGVSAWLISALVFFDVLESLESQLFVFGAAALALIVGLRRWVKDKFYGHVTDTQDLNRNLEEFAGKRVMVLEDIAPGRTGGRVEFRGSTWNAVSDESLRKGETAIIVRNDGLTLIIKR